MPETTHPDIVALEGAFAAAEQEARALVSELAEPVGVCRPDAHSWTVAECLDHIAIANRVYLRAMEAPAGRALSQGRRRRRPALPGLLGGWFVRSLEPPVNARFKRKSPPAIRPRHGVSLADAVEQFFASQEEVRSFLRRHADIDLYGVRFPNPFVRGLRFSLATGLHVLAAHERRHLWQARRLRDVAERAIAG